MSAQKPINKKYSIDIFNKLSVSIPCQAQWVKSDEPFVEITATKKFLDNIGIKVKDEALCIEPTTTFIVNNKFFYGDVQNVYEGDVVIENQIQKGNSDIVINLGMNSGNIAAQTINNFTRQNGKITVINNKIGNLQDGVSINLSEHSVRAEK